MYKKIKITVRIVVMDSSFIFGQHICFIVKGIVYYRAGRVAIGLKSDIKGRLSFILSILLLNTNYYMDR